MGKLVPRELEIPIVGLNHRVTPSTRRLLEDRVKEGTISARLEREPDNIVDKYAVKVIISGSPYKGLHIGYIPKVTAAIMGPAIDAGKIDLETQQCEITDIDAANGTGTMYAKFKAAVKMGGSKSGKKEGAKKKKR